MAGGDDDLTAWLILVQVVPMCLGGLNGPVFARAQAVLFVVATLFLNAAVPASTQKDTNARTIVAFLPAALYVAYALNKDSKGRRP